MKKKVHFFTIYNKTHIRKGSDNGNWKGDEVGYKALHYWLNQNFGKDRKCEHCESTKKKMYSWAKKKGLEYKRDRTHFIRLCQSCHLRYDFEPSWGKKSGLARSGLKRGKYNTKI